MNLVAQLIQEHFTLRQGQLFVGGVSVAEIARTFGTPLFVYDSSVLAARWRQLRATFPPEFSIYYSAKANPTRALLQFFLARGAGLEIASAGEFEQALHAGYPPDRIVFAGPGKTKAELERVISGGIGEIHVESMGEAQRIARISQSLQIRSSMALRVNPTGEAQGGAMRMGGKPSPFGIDEEQLNEVLDYIFGEPALQLRGIHLFSATQILDYEILLAQYRKGIEIGRRVAGRMNTPLHTLDFGGGLGIPYFENDKPLDRERLREGLLNLQEELRSDPLLSTTRFIVEPGRYLVGECGIYVVQILDVKISRGRHFYICDGGMHHHLAASGNLGQTIKRNFPIAVLNRIGESPLKNVDVVGPLCTPLDMLGRSVALPPAEAGDLIGIFQSGAYARSASPLAFLSHPSPAEVLVQDGEASLIRAAGGPEDHERDQRTPPVTNLSRAVPQ